MRFSAWVFPSFFFYSRERIGKLFSRDFVVVKPREEPFGVPVSYSELPAHFASPFRRVGFSDQTPYCQIVHGKKLPRHGPLGPYFGKSPQYALGIGVLYSYVVSPHSILEGKIGMGAARDCFFDFSPYVLTSPVWVCEYYNSGPFLGGPDSLEGVAAKSESVGLDYLGVHSLCKSAPVVLSLYDYGFLYHGLSVTQLYTPLPSSFHMRQHRIRFP